MKNGLIVAALAGCLLVTMLPGAEPPRVVYSNDATNLLSAPSPRLGDDAAVPERLAESVREVAGVGVHLLQPGNGWVPWWRSAQYPADAHYRWFQEISGHEPDAIGRYMRDGGDLVEEFVRVCRAHGVSPGVSLRLNDYHGSETWDILCALVEGGRRGEAFPVSLVEMASQSRVLLERHENRLRPDPADYASRSWAEKLAYISKPETRIRLRTARIWDWVRPEVPAYKLGFIRELCANYDIDGLELDFMRWSAFFRTEEVPVSTRRRIMREFIAGVREALDAGARAGQRRWFGVRVPSHLSGHDPLGIDLPAWVKAGVDRVNLSCHYVTEQQTDLAEICASVPGTPVYLEVTFASTRRRARTEAGEGGYRLLAPEQLATAAHLAMARGASGVSVFNFAYYRTLGSAPMEPPFAVLEKLNDPAWLASQPQHYFLSEAGNPPSGPSEFARGKRLEPGVVRRFHLDAAPPKGGWKEAGRLRIETREPLGDRVVDVRLNDRVLARTDDVAERYGMRGVAESAERDVLRAWTVPRELLRDGRNRIEITLVSGRPIELWFIDLAVQ